MCAGEFDYIYFKICGYSDEANDVLGFLLLLVAVVVVVGVD